MPHDTGDNILEKTLCRAISLTGHEVTPDEKQGQSNFKIYRQKIKMFNPNKQKSFPAKIVGAVSIKIFM